MGSMRILVVDDDEAILEIIATMLRGAGHEIECASDGKEAFRVYRERGPFGFVLTGLAMPGMNGVELIGAIARASHRQNFGFMTAHRVLQKPFAVEQLLAFVEGK